MLCYLHRHLTLLVTTLLITESMQYRNIRYEIAITSGRIRTDSDLITINLLGSLRSFNYSKPVNHKNDTRTDIYTIEKPDVGTMCRVKLMLDIKHRSHIWDVGKVDITKNGEHQTFKFNKRIGGYGLGDPLTLAKKYSRHWGEWGEWTCNSSSSEDVISSRRRTCLASSPLCDGYKCAGKQYELRQCKRPVVTPKYTMKPPNKPALISLVALFVLSVGMNIAFTVFFVLRWRRESTRTHVDSQHIPIYSEPKKPDI